MTAGRSGFVFAVFGFAAAMFMAGAIAIQAAWNGDTAKFVVYVWVATYFGWLVWLVDGTEDSSR